MKRGFEGFVEQFAAKELITSPDIELLGNTSSVQLSRWVKEGKLLKLKKGFYLLSETYRKKPLAHCYFANQLVWPSYLGLEKALEYWGMIPERVHTWTSVTTKRPQSLETEIGVFSYRHIKSELFWGYIEEDGGLISIAEKSLLDVFYFHPGPITKNFISELRLQNIELIDLEKLTNFSIKFDSEKIRQGASLLIEHLAEHTASYKEL